MEPATVSEGKPNFEAAAGRREHAVSLWVHGPRISDKDEYPVCLYIGMNIDLVDLHGVWELVHRI